jgi:hypothetical protein
MIVVWKTKVWVWLAHFGGKSLVSICVAVFLLYRGVPYVWRAPLSRAGARILLAGLLITGHRLIGEIYHGRLASI